jgi:hypothetical protein
MRDTVLGTFVLLPLLVVREMKFVLETREFIHSLGRLVLFETQSIVWRSWSHGLAATDGFEVALGAAGFAAEDAFYTFTRPTEYISVILIKHPWTTIHQQIILGKDPRYPREFEWNGWQRAIRSCSFPSHRGFSLRCHVQMICAPWLWTDDMIWSTNTKGDRISCLWWVFVPEVPRKPGFLHQRPTDRQTDRQTKPTALMTQTQVFGLRLCLRF